MRATTIILSLLFAESAIAQGVTATEILLGQSCALKGQAAGLGIGLKTGLDVWFDKVNGQGGACTVGRSA